MIGLVRSGVALATHWISDTIDVSPEARRAADAASTAVAAERLITPAVSDDCGDADPPNPRQTTERQLRSRAAVERLLGCKLT